MNGVRDPSSICFLHIRQENYLAQSVLDTAYWESFFIVEVAKTFSDSARTSVVTCAGVKFLRLTRIEDNEISYVF